MFVMTVDQRRSRRDIDRVQALLDATADAPLIRPFERTAGDEVQAVAADARTVVDLALSLVRHGKWSVGIGVGPVEQPLPPSTRAGRGPAFEAARDAVTRAKNAPAATAVATSGTTLHARCRDAEIALTLVALLVTDRTPQGHEATDLMAAGHTQKDAADILGITKQAMSQRLSVARWSIEDDGRRLVERLLTELDLAALPTEQQPTEQQPAEQQPAEQQPAEQQPAEQQPAEQQPAEQQLTEQQPTGDRRDIS